MNEEEMQKNQALIKKAYAAFNKRDIDSILGMMHPNVRWTKAAEGKYANGQDEVRAYWEKQWKEINPRVIPVGFRERENGTLEVDVDQLVKDLDDAILFEGKVKHIYTIQDGLIHQMDVVPSYPG